MNVMNYKGYAARLEYREEDSLFVGHIAGIRDVVGFHGSSVKELRAAFAEAVDDYLDTCAKLGRAHWDTKASTENEPASSDRAD